ncbi:MAG: hypothetical protein NC180_10620 [Muribaculaceae bacterium]|nr:hypothetical protein [Muribaculaceae bacterium]MCM1560218.1 hypothetical protein [Butyrivibrio sp.]
MSNKHKNPTISFRVSDAERKQIEARILASGLMKKDYFIRSCINNQICVVGKKETIYPLLKIIQELYQRLVTIQHETIPIVKDNKNYSDVSIIEQSTKHDIAELQENFSNMLNAIIDLLEGAKYLWEGCDYHV